MYKSSDKNVLDVNLSDFCLMSTAYAYISKDADFVNNDSDKQFTYLSERRNLNFSDMWYYPLKNKNAIYSSSVKLTKDQFPFSPKKNYNEIKKLICLNKLLYVAITAFHSATEQTSLAFGF